MNRFIWFNTDEETITLETRSYKSHMAGWHALVAVQNPDSMGFDQSVIMDLLGEERYNTLAGIPIESAFSGDNKKKLQQMEDYERPIESLIYKERPMMVKARRSLDSHSGKNCWFITSTDKDKARIFLKRMGGEMKDRDIIMISTLSKEVDKEFTCRESAIRHLEGRKRSIIGERMEQIRNL